MNKMTGVTENKSKFQACMAVRFPKAKCVSESDIHCSLVTVSGQKVVNQKEVSVRCNKFKDSH
jgi:hypothetical protein